MFDKHEAARDVQRRERVIPLHDADDVLECSACIADGSARLFGTPVSHDVAADMQAEWADTVAANPGARSFVIGPGEVRVTNAETGGMKGSKLARFDMLPAAQMIELAEHYGKGEAKYPTGADRIPNFRKGYAWSLSFAALMRHATQFWAGEDIDPETGSKHMIAVAWHALNLATYIDEHPELDDRV